MGDISKNFSWYEVANKYDPFKLPTDVKDNLRKLINTVLQPARDKLGSSIHTTSGYRSPEHNLAVGGSSKSQHIRGTAVDIYCPRLRGNEFFSFMLENFLNEIGGLGLYYNEQMVGKFIHVDIRAKIDDRVTTWYRDSKGNYTGLPAKYNNLRSKYNLR